MSAAPLQDWDPFSRAALWLGRRTLLGRGRMRGRLVKWLKRRVGSAPFAARVHGCPVELALDNATDFKTALNPRGHNAAEIRFLAAALQNDGAVLVDVGANTGLISLGVAQRAPRAHIIAIEANPTTAARAQRNLIDLNPQIGARAQLIEAAVGAREGRAVLTTSRTNLGSIAARPQSATASNADLVRMAPLATLLREAGVNRVDALKLDIEGGEDSALPPFLDQAGEASLPRAVVIERPKGPDGPALTALKRRGFVQVGATRNNLLFARPSGRGSGKGSD